MLIGGESIGAFSDARLSAFRRRKLGFVFQFFHLLPTLTAEENVCLPLLLDGERHAKVAPKAAELLERFGLGSRRHHRPDQLSGGEMQRVAIARALANGPRLLLADEPTGELDEATGAQIAALLDRVNQSGTALVIVTHDPALANRARRVLTMRDGGIESEQVT